ncbi:MAG: methyltransferase domain-containing protein [Ignavibacteria bacterium]
MYRFTSPAEFENFTYSKKKHFKLFDLDNFDIKLFGKKIDPSICDLKNYQDLLVFSFLVHNLPENAKILEVGGADSRILSYFKDKYECWNIDKMESTGKNGRSDFKLVNDYIGNSNKELPDDYFDLVFSISVFQDSPNNISEKFKDLTDDLNRVIKPGGFSLHCFDVIFLYSFVWTNDLLINLFETQNPVNKFVDFENMKEDEDLYIMSEKAYNKTWKSTVKQPYEGFKPLSYNILWQKPKKDSGIVKS